MKIVIIDYGSGNLRSVSKAFERILKEENLPNFTVEISDNFKKILNADYLVLPGVGAFPDCIDNLKKIGADDAIKEHSVIKKRPFMGVCVGMQLLANFGYEHLQKKGLGIIDGEVISIAENIKKLESEKSIVNNNTKLKLPHMGWNEVTFHDLDNPISKNIKQKEHFYFVHSYLFNLRKKDDLVASALYGCLIPAIIGHENIIAAQFHPEKSGKAGLTFLSNFLKFF